MLLDVALLDRGDQLAQLRLVLGAHLGEGNHGCSLLVNNSSETGLTLDDGVRNTHLTAERRNENNQLNWIDIVGNQDKVGLFVLNESNNVVETVLDGEGLLGYVFALLALRNSCGFFSQALLLLRLSFRAVFVEELESLRCLVLVERVLELSKSRWDLEAHVQNLALALETDIFRPLDHARHIADWLDILTDPKVARALLNQRILGTLLG